MKKLLNRAAFLLLLALSSFILTDLIAASFRLTHSRSFYFWAAVICIFVWVCFNIRHMRIPGVLLCSAVMFFVCRHERTALITQLSDLADKVSGQYLDHFYYSAEVYAFSNLTDDHTLTLLIIYFVICILMASVLSAENGRIFSGLLISGTLFAVCICVNGFPPVYLMVGFLLFWALLLVSGGTYSDSSCGGRTTFILAVPVLLLLCLLLSFSPPDEYDLSDEDIDMAQQLDALGQRITKIFTGRFSSDTPDTTQPSDAPSDGIFNDMSISAGWSMGDGTLDLSEGYPDFDRTQLMLRVRAEQSGYMYLRCFSYGNYLGSGWSTAKQYPSGDPLVFSAHALRSSPGSAVYSTDIELLATGKTVLPLPYYSLQDSGNDVFVQSGGEASYTAEYISYSGNTYALSIPDEYAQAEADYRTYVHEYYTELPDSTRSAILDIAADAGIPSGDADIINRVAAFVQGAAEYDLSVTGFDSDDYAVYFLREAKRGYCTHFATAAAVMYRALGIPARVVDGFAFSTTAGEYVNVYRSDEHAWVEVYADGLGWLPVEVTGSAVSSNTPHETAQPESSEDAAPDHSDTPVTPTITDSAAAAQDIIPVGIISSDVSENTAGMSNSAKKALTHAVIVIAAIGCIILWQFVLLRERKRRFTQRDSSRAVLYIYNCSRTLSRFGADIPREIVSIAEKVRFSQHSITREERLAAYALFIDMRDKLCSGQNVFRRFLIRYILGFR